MAVGWACPRCDLVLAPSVTVHRCDLPSAGVTTVAPWQPTPGPVGISAPNVTVTWPDTWTVTTTNLTGVPHTTGHLSVAGGYLAAVPDTDGMPPRREITEDAA